MFGIKKYFRRRYLKRDSSNVKTGLAALDTIHTASIIIDAEESSSDICKEKALTFFRSRGIRPEIFFFDFSKKTEDERQITSLKNTILRNDLNWCGRPSRDKMELLTETNSDMFISLIDNDDFAIESFAKASPSRFKVGRKQLPGRTFDLVIEDPAGTSLTQEEAFAEMTRIFDTIK